MIPRQIQVKLNTVAAHYARELYEKSKSVLSKDLYSNTGALVDSLKVSVIPGRDNAPPEIVLEYADQGYFIGYKSPKWTRVPNIEKLREWAKTVEFSGPVPGYKNGAATLPPWKAKERIISAIAWNQRKNDAWKAKPWKGRKGINLGELLRDLNQDTLTAWSREVEAILVQGIESGAILS